MPGLFDSFTFKGLTVKNRIMMSPMCQYSVEARDGRPEDWHYVHYVSRAVGGAGLIMIEMTDVHPDGRISDRDLGIWSDDHIPAFRRVIEACKEYGTKVGIQIAHAGRKAESESLNPSAPSAIPFSEKFRVPHEMSQDEVEAMVERFAQGAERAVQAGADTIEIHGAHGYLIHQFISRISNKRTDKYGEANQFASEVIQAIRKRIPEEMPLLMRLSAVEYAEGGYDLEETIERVRLFRELGVDAFDLSSGGEAPGGPGPIRTSLPGYQVPFAEAVRQAVNVPVIAVGNLDDPKVAEMVLQNEQADMVAIGRGMLRNPYWANEAAIELGHDPVLPRQYERAF
ncbi:NADH:flavin oxidoreductase/NADH oxidase [Desmospora activa]|uniref:2,4-dienoyl-CoA reductase-like NADH-dependent reductase (Old Yellow Enzyme family) n=1 Tax=Desmospora activa DSM 45169 TaxID=1121389 RepID=A0A2T4Z7F7_9BACL|nr:NADH:flavin oxidoreductase/NADH oxidase [Desmospora activa]PTM57795.1 2,4-dienoyl-CoA reductase-like NADH-dependent reductase (Old Yellow Enzyme family) [Desmospora activa DSM 45169]